MNTFSLFIRGAFAGCLLLWLTGCSSQVSLPSISEGVTGVHQPGRVVWHDLLTEDAEVTEQFYRELFGWQFRSVGVDLGFGNSLNYQVIENQGVIIGGMVDASRFDNPQNQSQWVSVISTGDIDASVEQLQAAGGLLQGGPIDLGPRGQLAVVADPQGALFALLQTRDGDPTEQAPRIGDFLWNELWTADSRKAEAFYQQLFGYQLAERELVDASEGADSYRYLTGRNEAGEQVPRVAMRSNPIVDLDPTWVSYVRAADPEAIVQRVESLGGRVLLAPQQNEIGGTLAIISDPSGAGLVVQTWDGDRQQTDNQQAATGVQQ